jgi:hypothetical protein
MLSGADARLELTIGRKPGRRQDQRVTPTKHRTVSAFLVHKLPRSCTRQGFDSSEPAQSRDSLTA